MAYRKYLVKFDENKRDVFDQRKKFAEAIFSYFTETGIEYRKKYQAESYTPENKFFDIAPKEINVN